MTSIADRLAKAAKAGALQTLSEPTQPDPTLPLLRKVRDYLSDPKRWTKNHMFGSSQAEEFAIGRSFEYGYAVSKNCPACLVGACFLVSGEYLHPTEERRFARALGFRWTREMFEWNDAPERTHREVVDLLDASIARLEAGA